MRRSLPTRAADLGRVLLARYTRTTAAVAALAAAAMVFTTRFDLPLREDAYLYVVKALEIGRGDWTPVHAYLIGWPAVLAGVLKLLGIRSLWPAMVAARSTTIVLAAAGLPALAIFGARIVGRPGGLAVVCLFALTPWFRTMSKSGLSEPLFLGLVLAALAVLVGARRSIHYLVAAGLAGLAAHVRPDGLLLLPVVLALAWMHGGNAGAGIGVDGATEPLPSEPVRPRRHAGSRHLGPIHSGPSHTGLTRAGLTRVGLTLAVVAIFALISAPQWILRAHVFGSPFDYGENSKIFVDSYDQVWTDTVPVPTPWEYFTTHGPADWFEKFGTHGLFAVGRTLARMLGDAGALLFVLALGWIVARRRWTSYRVPLVFLAFFFAGYSLVFDVFGVPRHLWVLIPAVLLILVGCLRDLARRLPRPSLWVTALLLLALVRAPLLVYRVPWPCFRLPYVRDQWAHWAATHLQGPIGIVDGGDLLQMCLPSPPPVAGLEAGQRSPVPVFRPGPFADLDTAYKAFLRRGARYLVVSPSHLARRPYLREVYQDRWRDRLVLVRSFRESGTDGIGLVSVDVFRIES